MFSSRHLRSRRQLFIVRTTFGAIMTLNTARVRETLEHADRFYAAYHAAHVTVFTHVSLTDLLSASGFCVEKVVPRFMPFSMQSCLPQWSWAVALYLRSPIRPMAKQMLIVATVREGH